MKWFRLSPDLILKDYRFASLEPSTFRFWLNCLCTSSHLRLKGALPENATLAFYVRQNVKEVEGHIAVLVEAGIFGIDGATGNAFVLNWNSLHNPKVRAYPKDWQSLRLRVFERDNFTCRYCGATGVELHCDHVQPYSRGGASDLENLVTACSRCNSSKRDKTLKGWRP